MSSFMYFPFCAIYCTLSLLSGILWPSRGIVSLRFPGAYILYPVPGRENGEAEDGRVLHFRRLDYLFYLDLTRGIAAGNLPRRCKDCGHRFVAVGGYNTQYCDRPIPGQSGKSCRSVGTHETAKWKLRAAFQAGEIAESEYCRKLKAL